MTVEIRLPTNALIAMCGPSGSGKTHFVHGLASPVVEGWISSDVCRAILRHGIVKAATMRDTEDLKTELSEGAFTLVRAWARARLAHNLAAVVDATNLSPLAWNDLAELASEHEARLIKIYMDTPIEECLERNAGRERKIAPEVVQRQWHRFKPLLRQARKDKNAFIITPKDDVAITYVNQTPYVAGEARPIHAGYDVIGDVHGCLEELVELLGKLGYAPNIDGHWFHPEARIPIFVGDLVDRGPASIEVLHLVRSLVDAHLAEAVIGNHDEKFMRWLQGRNVKVAHGLEQTIAGIHDGFDKKEVIRFLGGRKPYLVLTVEGGNPPIVVTHAAFKQKYFGRLSPRIHEYCRYGPSDGELPNGLPNRIDWARDYVGGPFVVFGHTPCGEVPVTYSWAINIDTGCVFGGSLTAYRYPECEFVSVKAKQAYASQVPDLVPSALPAPIEPAAAAVVAPPRGFDIQDLLSLNFEITDHLGKPMRIRSKPDDVKIALEKFSSRTIDPADIVFLAPTMSPGPVSEVESALEDPVTTARALWDAAEGKQAIVLECKHMGSRGTIFIDEKGVRSWSKNGYDIFPEPFKTRIHAALLDQFERKAHGGRLIFDCEVMPWNLRGETLVERSFYVPGQAGRMLRQLQSEATTDPALRARWEAKLDRLTRFMDVVDRYCWKTNPDDLSTVKIAPFELLAADNELGSNFIPSRRRQTEAIRAFWEGLPFFTQTERLDIPGGEWVAENDERIRAFFDSKVDLGYEGIIVKYDDSRVWGTAGFAYPQKQLKCRGKEYLRIIYGPEYDQPDILADLRKTRSTRQKQRIAYTETLLAESALKKFLGGADFEDYHRDILAAAAADVFPVDPRL